MKTLQSRLIGGALVALATLSLAGCTYYRTTEQQAPAAASNTVIVPRASAPTVVQRQGPSAVVLPKSQYDDETVIVNPDSTVTVTPRPNE